MVSILMVLLMNSGLSVAQPGACEGLGTFLLLLILMLFIFKKSK